MYYLLGFTQDHKIYIAAQGGRDYIVEYKKTQKVGYGPNDWKQLRIVVDMEEDK